MGKKILVFAPTVRIEDRRDANKAWGKLPSPKRKIRAYFDNNIPVAVAERVRRKLKWDVVAVGEDALLRHREDEFHYRNARQSRRLLFTRDSDFLDDKRFPLRDSPGVFVLTTQNDIDDVYFAMEATAFFLVEVYRKVPGFIRSVKVSMNTKGQRIKFITKKSEVIELVAPFFPNR